MPSRIVLFGATGHTGRLTAERLVAAGERPVLAARSEAPLAALAERLGGLEHRVADVYRQNSVFELVGHGDVLISCVGPFTKWGEPAVRAAIAAGASYLDSTGEPEWIRRVWEEFGPAARRSGAALLPAMGFDFVPGALAGALALDAAGEDAVRVDVGYFSLGLSASAASEGTLRSLVGATLGASFAWREGRLATARAAERVRTFDVGGRSRQAIAVGGAEHFALPQAYERLQEVNVYLGWFGPLARPLQAATLLTSAVTRLPGARSVLQAAGERLVGFAPTVERGAAGQGESHVIGEAFDAGGRRLSQARLSGAEGYAFTAGMLAWAAGRLSRTPLGAPGAHGPIGAFGVEALQQGCETAGLRYLRSPSSRTSLR